MTTRKKFLEVNYYYVNSNMAPHQNKINNNLNVVPDTN